MRQDFFDELHNLHAEYSRGGPVGYCGDFNSKTRTRALDERTFFGLFLFNPPPVDAAAPPPQPTNRDLLSSFCSSADTVVYNIFQSVNAHLPKPPPIRPYISSVCLLLIEERSICWRNNFQQRYNELNKCIAKQAAKDREYFIKDLIETTNWQG